MPPPPHTSFQCPKYGPCSLHSRLPAPSPPRAASQTLRVQLKTEASRKARAFAPLVLRSCRQSQAESQRAPQGKGQAAVPAEPTGSRRRRGRVLGPTGSWEGRVNREHEVEPEVLRLQTPSESPGRGGGGGMGLRPSAKSQEAEDSRPGSALPGCVLLAHVKTQRGSARVPVPVGSAPASHPCFSELTWPGGRRTLAVSWVPRAPLSPLGWEARPHRLLSISWLPHSCLPPFSVLSRDAHALRWNSGQLGLQDVL